MTWKYKFQNTKYLTILATKPNISPTVRKVYISITPLLIKVLIYQNLRTKIFFTVIRTIWRGNLGLVLESSWRDTTMDTLLPCGALRRTATASDWVLPVISTPFTSRSLSPGFSLPSSTAAPWKFHTNIKTLGSLIHTANA